MLVSGGKILAIDEVLTDWTVSGDGVKEPLGLDRGLYEEIQRVSGDQAKIEALKAHSGAWDDTYSAVSENSGKWFAPDIFGHEGVSAEYDPADHKYIVGLSGTVELQFESSANTLDIQQKAEGVFNFDISKASADHWNGIDALSAQSAYCNQASDEVANTSSYWNTASDEVAQHSAYWNQASDEVAENSAKWNAYSGFIDECMKTSALYSGAYQSAIQDEEGSQLKDADGDGITDAADAHFWSAYSGLPFFAQRASADAFGNLFQDEYATKDELNDFYTKEEADARFFPINGLDETSGRWETTSDTVDSNSAKLEKLYETSSTWNGVEALSAHSGAWDSTHSAVRDTSADWNKTHEDVEASAYLWNSAYSETSAFKEVDSDLWQTASETVAAQSAYWDEASNIVAENSGKWNGVSALSAHSAAWDNAYSSVAANSAKWNEIYGASASWNNKMERSELSAYSAEIDTWYAKKSELPEAPGIQGYSGVSASYDEINNKYLVALSGQKELVFTSSAETIDLSSSGVGHFNIDVKQGTEPMFGIYRSAYTAIGTTKTEITLVEAQASNTFDLDDMNPVGLYHVDLNLEIQRNSNNLGANVEELEFYENSSDVRPKLKIGGLDASNDDVNHVNLSYDVIGISSLGVYLKAPTAGWTVQVVLLDIHRVFDHDLVGDIIAGETTYYGGDGIEIGTGKTINAVPGKGMTIDEDGISLDASSGIKFNAASGAYISLSSGLKFTPDERIMLNTGSGLKFNTNGELEVYLGPGLKFETSGSIAAITVDNKVEEVIEEVEQIQSDMDNKLTTNFPYPMITDVSYDFGSIGGGGSICICQLFSVPFRHPIVANNTHIMVYAKDNGYNQSNVMFGIYEYDPEGNGGTGTTNFVCDTGAVSIAKASTSDILEFPIIHVNPNHNALRPDCMYYAVLALPANAGQGIFLAAAKNYDASVNSTPTLNWRMANVGIVWDGGQSGDVEATLDDTQVSWWTSNYNEVNGMYRFFMQLRNHNQSQNQNNS